MLREERHDRKGPEEREDNRTGRAYSVSMNLGRRALPSRSLISPVPRLGPVNRPSDTPCDEIESKEGNSNGLELVLGRAEDEGFPGVLGALVAIVLRRGLNHAGGEELGGLDEGFHEGRAPVGEESARGLLPIRCCR